MRNTSKFTVASLLLAISPFSHADGIPGIDFSAGAGFMHLSPEGIFAQDDSNPAGGQWLPESGALPLAQSDTAPYVWASLETITPIVPHFRIEHWQLATNQRKQSTPEIGLQTEFSLRNTTLNAYYSPLNNWLKLDLGFQLRWLDASVRATPGDMFETEGSIQVPVLGLYSQAAFALPSTGLLLGVSYAGSGLGDNRFSETGARLTWQHGLLGAELGYRRLALVIQDGPYHLDVDFNGPYAGVTLAF